MFCAFSRPAANEAASAATGDLSWRHRWEIRRHERERQAGQRERAHQQPGQQSSDPGPRGVADPDPAETADWLASLESVLRHGGAARARFLLDRLEQKAREIGVVEEAPPYSPYRNTIPLEKQPPYPGDLAVEERITSIMRWNALAMVVRANMAYGELGGHVASTLPRPRSSSSASTTSSRPATRAARRRSRILPAAFGARRLCPCLPGGAALRDQPEALPPGDRRRGPVLVPASLADARLLAGADRLDGHRADERDLPGALHALPQRPRPRRNERPARLGRVRRRRDGRAGIDRRAHAGGARKARQRHLRHQLQPATARRAGARQRPDHPGAGERLPRRRLERRQGAVGLGMGRDLRPRHQPRPLAPLRRHGGRQVPDARRQGRRLQPRPLLR